MKLIWLIKTSLNKTYYLLR